MANHTTLHYLCKCTNEVSVKLTVKDSTRHMLGKQLQDASKDVQRMLDLHVCKYCYEREYK